MALATRTRRERQRAEQRAELLEAAHALVKEEGYEGLTIRKLANKVGYAPMSVYSYFEDKHAILMALAEDAFGILARRIERRKPADPLQGLRVGLLEYAAFGLENPNEYRTIFMTRALHDDGEKNYAEIEAKNPALQVMLKGVGACVETGVMRGEVHAIATLLWTFMHGAISLLISFPFYPFGDAMTYCERVVDLALSAVQNQDVPELVPPERLC